MKNKQHRFWRGFTWKRWLLTLAWIFPFMAIWNLLFIDWSLREWERIFTWEQGGKTLTSCIIISLIVTIWHEPGKEDKEQES
jgi:hypothetical protein